MLKILVHLDEDFYNQLDERASNELYLASEKFRLNLREDEVVNIVNHSLEQLKEKVRKFLNAPSWELRDPEVLVSIPSSFDFNYVEGDCDKEIYIKKVRYEYRVEEETSEGTLIKDFPEEVRESIIEWVLTAIFYGVESYSDERH